MDNPSFKLELSAFSNHTISQPDLSHLVVEEDGNIVGETWASEMWEWDLSSSKSGVQEWNIKEKGNESGLEEDSEVTERVDHSLLGEGQVSGLANHEISPLHANDGYKIAGLSELEGLGGVANWVPLTSISLLVELWKGLVSWVVSALNPGIWLSVLSIEQSNINLSVLLLIPGKNGPVLLWSSVVSVSVEGLLGVGVSFSISHLGLNHGGLGNVVLISILGEWVLQESQEPNGRWANSEVIKDQEIGVDTSRSLNYTDLEVGE